jgi:hypothetical protein
MKFLNNITPLTKQDAENIKGGYLFSCEEKKRNMLISAYTNNGVLINTYKVATVTAETFIQNYQGDNKQ